MWHDPYTLDAGCKIERYAGSGTAGDPYLYRVAANYANRPVNYVSWGLHFLKKRHIGLRIGGNAAQPHLSQFWPPTPVLPPYGV